MAVAAQWVAAEQSAAADLWAVVAQETALAQVVLLGLRVGALTRVDQRAAAALRAAVQTTAQGAQAQAVRLAIPLRRAAGPRFRIRRPRTNNRPSRSRATLATTSWTCQAVRITPSPSC